MLSPCHVMLASIQAHSQVQIPVSLHFRLTVKQRLVGCLQLAGALGESTWQAWCTMTCAQAMYW